jgi:succinate dehydrogenase / fumarate reductase flavoprotein subunit
MMGGIRVDAETQMTRVPGLFGAGECTAGMHGANRLGGNSLSDLLVFGRLSGVGAAEYIKGLKGEPQVHDEDVKAAIRFARAPLDREEGENPFVLHDDLRKVMGRHVGIWREKAGLEGGIAELEKLKERVARVKATGTSQYNPSWSEAIDLSGLLLASEAVTRAALIREESRGAHSREDFLGEQKEWGKVNIVIRKGPDGAMELEKVPKPEGPPELVMIANASIEDLEAGNV